MDYGLDTKFIFCPRCGAIMEPPVCRVCGYDMNAPEYPQDEYPQENFAEEGQEFAPEGEGFVASEGQGQGANYTQGAMPMGGPVPMTPTYTQPAGQQMGRQPMGQMGQQQQRPNGYFPNPDKQPGPKFTPAEKKKKKWWIPLIIVSAVILVLMFVCIGLIPTVGVLFPQILRQKLKQQASNVPSVLQSGSQLPSEIEANEEIVKRHFGRFDHEGMDVSFYTQMADISVVTKSGCFDPYINGNTDTYRDSQGVFDITHKNWKTIDFTPPYYEPFADSIDEISYSDQYQISREYYFFDDKMGSQRVVASVAYPQLSGNVPNLDDLNAEIFDRCVSDLYNFMGGTSQYNMYVFDTITFSVDAYIPYNDGKKMSVLLDCVVHTDDYSVNLDSYIYAINIDLEKGEIIENDQIINVDKDFAQLFLDRCLTQNGRNETYTELTLEQLADFLSDKENNIIFFTPLGLEVGTHFCYSEDILYRGWSTITLPYGEFEQYLKDPDLAKTGTPTQNPNDPKWRTYKENWTKVDKALGRQEEKKIKQDFPEYDWDNKEPVEGSEEEDQDESIDDDDEDDGEDGGLDDDEEDGTDDDESDDEDDEDDRDSGNTGYGVENVFGGV